MFNNERLHTNIKTLLKNNDLDQKDLADYIGISPQALSNRLSQRTPFSLDEINKIARFFNVSFATLLFGKVQEIPLMKGFKSVIGEINEKNGNDIYEAWNYLLPINIIEGTQNEHLIKAVELHRGFIRNFLGLHYDKDAEDQFYSFDPDPMLQEYLDALQCNNLDEQHCVRANICAFVIFMKAFVAIHHIAPYIADKTLRALTRDRVTTKIAKQREEELKRIEKEAEKKRNADPKYVLLSKTYTFLIMLHCSTDWKDLAEYYWAILRILDVGDNSAELAESINKSTYLLEYLLWSGNHYIERIICLDYEDSDE